MRKLSDLEALAEDGRAVDDPLRRKIRGVRADDERDDRDAPPQVPLDDEGLDRSFRL
jgi:hypothetical protein